MAQVELKPTDAQKAKLRELEIAHPLVKKFILSKTVYAVWQDSVYCVRWRFLLRSPNRKKRKRKST